jgi:hypothetical protein
MGWTGRLGDMVQDQVVAFIMTLIEQAPTIGVLVYIVWRLENQLQKCVEVLLKHVEGEK